MGDLAPNPDQRLGRGQSAPKLLLDGSQNGLLTTLCEENGAGGGDGTEKEARRKEEGKENGGAGILETMKAKMMTMKTNNNNNTSNSSRNRNNTLPPLPLTNGLRHRVHRSQSPSLFGSTKPDNESLKLMIGFPPGCRRNAKKKCLPVPELLHLRYSNWSLNSQKAILSRCFLEKFELLETEAMWVKAGHFFGQILPETPKKKLNDTYRSTIFSDTVPNSPTKTPKNVCRLKSLFFKMEFANFGRIEGTLFGAEGDAVFEKAAPVEEGSDLWRREELSNLNDRLANYIEKVRFLEAQNRKLKADLDMLQGRRGKDTITIKTMYESEINTAKKLIEDTGKSKRELEADVAKLQRDLDEQRRKYEEAVRVRAGDREKLDDLLVQLSNLEAEISLLKRHIALLEEELGKLRKENTRLHSDLQRVRAELDQETLNRIDYQKQTLLEEIDFIRRSHDQEIKDLQAMAARDTTSENREFFRNELASAIRDIRNEYDTLNNKNRNDVESWYKLKVQEMETQSARQNMEQGYQKDELKRLRVQLTDLRGKLSDLEARNSLLEKQTQELNYQLEDDQRAYENALNAKDAQMRDECQALMDFRVYNEPASGQDGGDAAPEGRRWTNGEVPEGEIIKF
uniref:IF rod domain-containing protein n=1 Tax=Globodera rostochiensis TaxID=31243 RepID=A0A914GY35_GLORO